MVLEVRRLHLASLRGADGLEWPVHGFVVTHRATTPTSCTADAASGLAEVGGAVEVDDGAAGPLGLRGCQVHHGRRDLAGAGDPAEGALRPDLTAGRPGEMPGRHGRLHEARRHGGDRDPVRAQGPGQRLGERVQPGLARPVGGLARLAPEGAAGGDVDDAAAAVGGHVLDRAPGHVRGPGEVDGERRLPGLLPLLIRGVGGVHLWAEVRGMARVLGACRESGKGEESISIKNQQNRIRSWADERGHTIVAFTVDKATSGGMPAKKRKDLGPWLTDPAKIAGWDYLVAAKLDRGWRSVLDFAQTQEWAEERGKAIASVAEGYDFTTPEGELMAYQLIAFAQFERKRAAQRRREGAETLLAEGRWNGGIPPMGYGPIGSKGNWRLAPGKVTGPITVGMVDDVIDRGKGFLTIAKELNARGIPTMRGHKWSGFAVKRVLTSPTLIGYGTHMVGPHKDIVTVRRDEQGQPIRITDQPLITEDRFRELQAVVKSRARGREAPQARHMLWRVAYCRNCSVECDDELPCSTHDVMMYGHRRIKHVEKGNRYRCPRCGLSASLPRLEAYVDYRVSREAGRNPLMEYVPVGGNDNAGEIYRLERRVERLREELDEDPSDAGLIASVTRNQAKLDELKNAPYEEPRMDLLPVVPAITIGEHWASLDTLGRNKYLRETGAWFMVGKDGVMSMLGYMDAGPDSGMRWWTSKTHLPLIVTWEQIDAMLAGSPIMPEFMQAALEREGLAPDPPQDGPQSHRRGPGAVGAWGPRS